MPSFARKGGAGEGESGGAERTTFRPPWVKEGPSPLPMPTAPWVRRSDTQPPQPSQIKDTVGQRRQSQVKIPPQISNENGKPEFKGDAPKKTVKIQPSAEQPKERSIPIKTEKDAKEPPKVKQEPPKAKQEPPKAKQEPPKAKQEPPKAKPEPPKAKQEPPKVKEEPPKAKTEPTKSVLVKQDSVKSLPPKGEGGSKEKAKRVRMAEEAPSVIPPPPPPVPPPPPPSAPQLPPIERKPMSEEKMAKLEALKARPRRRPDWTDMMKEVEQGIKLKHIQCNDRSAPVLPKAKAKGQFVYESEKENVHNQLLKQIQLGVRLKKTKTNDRSRPMIDGLRKFRRQMTIEEQIQKSASVADVVAAAAAPDELDDIDKVRDDLQSSKQMLALELRNKEALERENKRLMARLLNLEVELEKEKMARQIEIQKGTPESTRSPDDDKLIAQLKEESKLAAKMAKEMEDVYHKTAEELDVTRAKLESAWLQNAKLEMALKSIEKRGDSMPITKQLSKKLISNLSNVKVSNAKQLVESSSDDETDEDETETESETEEEDPAESSAALQEKRTARELKLMAAKLRTLKEKRASALKERSNLKELFAKLHKSLKEEKKKYKELQKEVDKMANLMKDVEEDEDEEEEDDDMATESESESEESEEEEDSEGDLPETAPPQEKMSNFTKRVKVYETRLTTLKKSNYLLKANIDRRQDDLNRQKEMSLSLQEDLNSVLAELG